MSRYSFMPLLPAIFAALVGLAGCDDDSREPSCEVSVTAPNGGETWAAGSTQTIAWDVSASCGPTVKIELLRNSTVCLTLASGVANNGSYAWTPVARCEGQTDGYKIRVTDWNTLASDESNGTFSISEPPCELTLTTPNGGESWAVGSSQTITWDRAGSCGPTVKIDLLQGDRACWTIASGVPNSGTFTWDSASQCGVAADGYKIRVMDWNTGASTTSAGTFSIRWLPCVMTVTSPNGGEIWMFGNSQTITWDRAGPCGGTVLIELLRDGSLCRQIASGVPNNGSYAWSPTVECAGSTHPCRVKVTDWITGASDESDEPFSIPIPACEFDVTSPNGGESWQTGSSQTIRWITRGSCDWPVKIELLRSASSVCRTIASDAPNSGSYIWDPVERCGLILEYRIRITDLGSGATDTSDGLFDIPLAPCTMIVTSPAGGDGWTAGSAQTIRWDNSGACGPTVKIELLRDGQACRLLASGVPNNGIYAWNPVWRCEGASDGYRIRVTDWNTTASGESDSLFSIPTGPCALLVTYPNGGESWPPESSQTITWEMAGTCGPAVRLELLRSGQVCRTIASGVANTGTYTWSQIERCSRLTEQSYQVRVTDGDTGVSDQSDRAFTMLAHPCVFTVTSPNGGEQWALGTSQTITWTRTGNCGYSVDIVLERNGSRCQTIVFGAGMTGSHTWYPVQRCGNEVEGYTVRVSDDDTEATDSSDEPFSIPVPHCAITVTSPTGGDRWRGGESHTITWDKAGGCGTTVKIELFRDGLPCATIANGVPNNGSYIWRSVGQCSGNIDGYKVSVTDWNSGDRGESDGVFSIYPPLTVPGMTLIFADTFTMGSPADEPGRQGDEGQHQVTLSRLYYLGNHEVTQLEWRTIMGWNDSYWRGDNNPVERVTWFDALEFCNMRSVQEGFSPAYAISDIVRSGYHIIQATVTVDWNADGYRLPTEAEWEYACRAGSESAFCNGAINESGCAPLDPILDAVGWYCGNTGFGGRTQAVAGKQANSLGFHDMHGNVSEWCWDWYGDYSGEPVTDPIGAASGPAKIRRGGSSTSAAASCRSAARDSLPPGVFDYVQWDCPGLRLARTTR